MNSYTTDDFRQAYRVLPASVRQQARKAYQLFRQDPYHPSLRFKRVHSAKPIYSARVSQDYRALAIRAGDDFVWFWIGSHSEYDKLLTHL